MREMEGPPDMGRTPILGTVAHIGDGACSRPQGQGQVGYNTGFQIVRCLSNSDPHLFLGGPNSLPLLPNMDLGVQPFLIWAAIGHPLDREERTRCPPKLDSGGWGVAGGWHGKGSAGVMLSCSRKQHRIQLSRTAAPAIFPQLPGSILVGGRWSVLKSITVLRRLPAEPQLLPASSTSHRAGQPAQGE